MLRPSEARASDEMVLKMFRNIKVSPEGPELIAYLEWMAHDNHQAFLSCDRQDEGVHKGQGIAIDNLLQVFANCEREDINEEQETPDRM